MSKDKAEIGDIWAYGFPNEPFYKIYLITDIRPTRRSYDLLCLTNGKVIEDYNAMNQSIEEHQSWTKLA